ncbi:ORMDL family-domain-containing protein [Boletus edulis]|uniref:ORMDL family-domain-containing protein n=1 Tax=Boletus edulis BED1 TaxID=1328754 RepID=A0AAD4GD18_BOLED|nr:ORMDL family-domain-containing protein [Boletus edulis]KAF8437216.1 ORMDL family-domain-containing protein [Boletus edulis BED1]
MSSPPTFKFTQLSLPHQTAALKGRKRSGSIVKVEEVGGRVEELLDRSAYVNINANWVDAKGAWLIHVVLVFAGKIIIDTIPGMTQQISWTMVNLIYLALSYLMFHWVTGIPFDNDLHAGAYDDLTLWEQIDDGAQYTPAKKWLVTAPILLFLASTHYTNYNPWLFAVNLAALIVLAIIPKLPQLHRQRVRFLSQDGSGMATPVTPSFSHPEQLKQIDPSTISEALFK